MAKFYQLVQYLAPAPNEKDMFPIADVCETDKKDQPPRHWKIFRLEGLKIGDFKYVEKAGSVWSAVLSIGRKKVIVSIRLIKES